MKISERTLQRLDKANKAEISRLKERVIGSLKCKKERTCWIFTPDSDIITTVRVLQLMDIKTELKYINFGADKGKIEVIAVEYKAA